MPFEDTTEIMDRSLHCHWTDETHGEKTPDGRKLLWQDQDRLTNYLEPS